MKSLKIVFLSKGNKFRIIFGYSNRNIYLCNKMSEMTLKLTI